MRALIINDTRGDFQGHFGCFLVMEHLTDALKQQFITDFIFSPVGEKWDDLQKRLESEKQDFDLVIVNGEGTLHDSLTYKRAKEMIYIVEKCAELYKKPIFLINSTLHNNDKGFYQKFRHFTKIFVRDKLSSDELTWHNIPHELVPDLTFDNKYSHKPRKAIAGTDSVYGHIDKDIIRYCGENQLEYCSMLSPESISWSDFKNIPVLKKKIKLHKALFKKKFSFPKTAKYMPLDNHHDFIEWISSKEMIITGRYHTVTMCIKTRTPFIAVASNTPKIQTLLEMVFGNCDRIVDSVADVEAKLEKYSRYSSEELENIEKFLANTKDAQADMFKELVNF